MASTKRNLLRPFHLLWSNPFILVEAISFGLQKHTQQERNLILLKNLTYMVVFFLTLMLKEPILIAGERLDLLCSKQSKQDPMQRLPLGE